MIIKIFIALQICHWIADYTPLSTPWMLKAKRFGIPLLPILAHAGVHAICMLIVMLHLLPVEKGWLVLQLSGFQLLTHFIIDVLKGKTTYYFPILQDNTKSPYWTLMGFDQLLHQVVIIIMVCYAGV